MLFEACRFCRSGLVEVLCGLALSCSFVVSGLGFYVSAGLVGFESLGFGLPVVSA